MAEGWNGKPGRALDSRDAFHKALPLSEKGSLLKSSPEIPHGQARGRHFLGGEIHF